MSKVLTIIIFSHFLSIQTSLRTRIQYSQRIKRKFQCKEKEKAVKCTLGSALRNLEQIRLDGKKSAMQTKLRKSMTGSASDPCDLICKIQRNEMIARVLHKVMYIMRHRKNKRDHKGSSGTLQNHSVLQNNSDMCCIPILILLETISSLHPLFNVTCRAMAMDPAAHLQTVSSDLNNGHQEKYLAEKC